MHPILGFERIASVRRNSHTSYRDREACLMTTSVTRRAIAGTLLVGAACSTTQAESAPTTEATVSTATSNPLDEITVTARRIDLIGKAASASEGVVADEEIQLAPAYRPGQLLET